MTRIANPPPNVDDPLVLKRYLRELAAQLGSTDEDGLTSAEIAALRSQLTQLTNRVNTLGSTVTNTIISGPSTAIAEVFVTPSPPTITRSAINFLATTVSGSTVYQLQVNA